jgi:hypothetical protein
VWCQVISGQRRSQSQNTSLNCAQYGPYNTYIHIYLILSTRVAKMRSLRFRDSRNSPSKACFFGLQTLNDQEWGLPISPETPWKFLQWYKYVYSFVIECLECAARVLWTCHTSEPVQWHSLWTDLGVAWRFGQIDIWSSLIMFYIFKHVYGHFQVLEHRLQQTRVFKLDRSHDTPKILLETHLVIPDGRRGANIAENGVYGHVRTLGRALVTGYRYCTL